MLFFNPSYGQKKVLKISTTDSTSTFWLRDIHFQKVHFNENDLLKTLDSVKLQIEEMGFVNYSLDSLIKSTSSISFSSSSAKAKATRGMNEDTLIVKPKDYSVNSSPPNPLPGSGGSIAAKETFYSAYFNLRDQIQKIKVYYDKAIINSNLLSEQNRKASLNYFEVTPESLADELQSISNKLEKQGNSFSEVALKNISIKNDTLIEANLFLKKSDKRKINKIIIEGYNNFPEAYLKHHLKLERNTLFKKEKLDETSNMITTIPFISEIKPPEVLFTKDSTIVYLYIKKENTNKFDGLIGFNSKENGKGLSFNGYLDLSLNNLFNSGENFNLVWKNNGNNRQIFNLDVSIPFILNSKVSPKLALNIYKQDSSFVNTKLKVSLPYRINIRNSIGLSLQSESSSDLLSITRNNIEDYKSIFFGLSYNYEIPNNHPLFKTKFNLFSEALAGKRNSSIKNNQTKFYLKANFLWSFNPKNHIFIQNLSGLINSEKIIDNELLRIGGTNNLRGFDEESILASNFSTFNIEYRYNTNNSSYFYSISDLAYVNNNRLSSQLYALGLGYAFSSKLGFINLSYALGKSSTTPFNFSNSRFHLKIVNFF